MRSISANPLIPADRRHESGQALAETAIALPVVFMLLFATMAFAGWYFSQSMAVVSTSTAGRTAGVRRGNVAAGQQVNRRLLRGVLGNTIGAYLAGDARVTTDSTRRAVIVRLRSSPAVRVPFLGTHVFEVFGGSFTRNWQFYGGPPNPWE